MFKGQEVATPPCSSREHDFVDLCRQGRFSGSVWPCCTRPLQEADKAQQRAELTTEHEARMAAITAGAPAEGTLLKIALNCYYKE